MRCDLPVGYDEDLPLPPAEIFLQLFIENPDEGDGEQLPEGDIEDFPMVQNILDHLIPDIGIGDDSSSLNSNFSMHIVSSNSEFSGESSDNDLEIHDNILGEEQQTGEVSNTECLASVVSDTSSEISVCDREPNPDINVTELQCKETYSKLSDAEASRDTLVPDENFPVTGGPPDDKLDLLSEQSCTPITLPSSENFDVASSSGTLKGTDNSDRIPTAINELSNEDQPSHEFEPFLGSSSAGTYASLLVVPPTNLSNEAYDNFLSTHSSDNTFSELLPVETPCTLESYLSGKENVQYTDPHEIRACVDNIRALSESSTCNAVSTNSDYQYSNKALMPHLLTYDSDFPVSQSVHENVIDDIDFENASDDIDFENSTFDSNQSENTGILLENEACSENLTDKSIVNKKRKVSTSTDESVINKVPKYSSSDTSTDSVNVQESVDSYCKVMSSNSDKQIPNDGDRADILQPAVPGDNVILTLGKAVEESSVVNEEPKSR